MSAPEDANSIVIDQMVDRQCDRFEQAWRSGEAKSIESWLDTDGKVAYQDIATDSLDNAQLFYKRLVVELIGLEISLRREQGETPQVHEYLQRFPMWIRVYYRGGSILLQATLFLRCRLRVH